MEDLLDTALIEIRRDEPTRPLSQRHLTKMEPTTRPTSPDAYGLPVEICDVPILASDELIDRDVFFSHVQHATHLYSR